MLGIPYETGAYYVFDRGYNNFGELFRIQRMEPFFVIRAKINLRYRCVRWKRRMPKSILTDAEIELAVYIRVARTNPRICVSSDTMTKSKTVSSCS